MSNTQRIAKGGFLLGMIVFASACVVATPREGYYDRGHHRYYHERTWHECTDRDEHCR